MKKFVVGLCVCIVLQHGIAALAKPVTDGNARSRAAAPAAAALTSLRLLAPDGGEHWITGQAGTITWTATGIAAATASLYFSVDAGLTWQGVMTAAATTGAATWKPRPRHATRHGRIRICVQENPSAAIICDSSDRDFSIALAANTAACAVKRLRISAVQGFKVYSPDGSRYLINAKDNNGIAQVYIAQSGASKLRCLTCVSRPRGPKSDRFKMQPVWHPSGRWIFMAAERDRYSAPFPLSLSRSYVEGQLQNGIWTNMYAVTPTGRRWYRLTNFTGTDGRADGYTGPAFTPDGRKAVWSQAADGNIIAYWPFGRWELTQADFIEFNGIPQLLRRRNITPAGMHWNEPGNFSPDNRTLVLTGSTEADAQGMDQYTLDLNTGKLANLTNSPTVWDEHGVFSPDGKKVLFMSAYPYRDQADASKVVSIKTEFMLLDVASLRLTQLTHFRQPGYPEYSEQGGIAANGGWSPEGKTLSLRRLFFPDYQDWTLRFQGACGNNLP